MPEDGELPARFAQLREFFLGVIDNIASENNDALRAALNTTAEFLSDIVTITEELNNTMYNSFLFDFFEGYKDHYVDDFISRFTYDLLRNLGHFER